MKARSRTRRGPDGSPQASGETTAPTEPCIFEGVVNTLFRVLLAIWTIGFLVVSCVPMLTSNVVVGGVGLIAGAVLLIPWLVGVLVLSVLVWLTNPRRS